jgi:hypothetical protein
MFKYIPVPLKDHEVILGKDFNTKFAAEMTAYYAPFIAKNRDIQIAKETWEYGVADSIPNAVWVGAGKNVVDVQVPNYALDVKGLSIARLGDSYSTEASFLQNNKKENDNFNKLFESQDYTALKTMFVDPLGDKVAGVHNLHLLAIVREKKTKAVYYTLLKMEKSSLTDAEFVAEMKMDAGRSVTIPMIDSAYGKTYIYIPKRRLEIRLNCDGLKDYLVYSHSY